MTFLILNPSPRPRFFQLWAPAFECCLSSSDLNLVLSRCVSDPSRQPNHRRTQSRQQQGVKQKRKSRADEASKIQRMFKIYPRRAVRQILGEKSLPYSGSREAASDFLRSTYDRPVRSNIQNKDAKHLFDTCNWSTPTEVQSSPLDTPPTSAEIEIRLRRASNTAPGADGLEYRHLRALDPQGKLLEVIFAAVWELGIPNSRREYRTIPIFKKGDTDDLSNFRPISLLSTIYKVFSGILCQRLTLVAADLGWLSPEQKGFLPGVNGIQEHTQLLQTAVEDAK